MAYIKDGYLYHAGCCIASNYVDTLIYEVAKLWKAMGIDIEDTKKAMIPLLRSVIDNLENNPLDNCLTGPISRNDVRTVEGHLEVIKGKCPEMLKMYQMLGKETVDYALSNGQLTKEEAEVLKEKLS